MDLGVQEDKKAIFKIDGAVVFRNMETVTTDTGEIAWKFPEIDKSYRYGMIYDDMK